MSRTLSSEAFLACLKAAGEPTRLRLLALLAMGEFNVKDLTRILGQSQPRISRHLRLLVEAGLIERHPEGSCVFFRLSDGGAAGGLARALMAALDTNDPAAVSDCARAEGVRRERSRAAQAYFRSHAGQWDRIRSLHIAEERVEAAMRKILGPGPFNLLVDIGTGTGRILELFADRARRLIGFDINREMLGYARAKLERAGLGHCQVRHGDLYSLPLGDGVADAIVLHQVLHFLDDPNPALEEAARILAPGGRALVVDFAPHGLDFLREAQAHRRLGFAPDQMARWIEAVGLCCERHRDLAPGRGAGEETLTVSLWLASRPNIVKSGAAGAGAGGTRRRKALAVGH